MYIQCIVVVHDSNCGGEKTISMKKNETKYEVIENHFLELMKNGTLTSGDRLPSENEIAQKFNVSRHTVRQALGNLYNNGMVIKEKGRGTFCSNILEKRPIKNVAVLTTYISNYIFPKITEGIEDVLRKKGYNLLLFSSNNDIQNEMQCLENIAQQNNISGLIFEPSQSAINNLDQKYLEKFDEKNIKYIMINAFYEKLNPAYIVLNDKQGGYRATRYLIELGHKNIAALMKIDDLQGKKREEGYIEALSENGIPVNRNLIGEYNTENKEMYIIDFVKKIINLKNRPTAIFCYNDEIALKVIEILREQKIFVPKDISIVGFDDSNLATASEIKLTTIIHPKKKMGEQAAKYLVEMINDNLKKPQYVYDAELIVRNSCRRNDT